MSDAPSTQKTLSADRLLALVHERTNLGMDITTWIDHTVEIRWKRDYEHEGWSDERFVTANSLVEALQAVLDYEDEADREDEGA